MSELQHHGILGQRWGVRRYQNYDGTLTDAGKSHLGKTKYTNIDGSLNEKGKIHSGNYVSKQIAKNDKYYQKYIDKYQKLADKNSDNKELNKKFLDMKKSAENTRDSVDDYIKKMNIDQIINEENKNRDKVMKVAGAVAGTAATAALGVTLPTVIGKGIASASTFLATFDPSATMESVYSLANTPQGMRAMNYVDSGIRAYSDVRAYTLSIAADQTIKRMQKNGTIDQVSGILGEAARKSSASTINNVSAELLKARAAYV